MQPGLRINITQSIIYDKLERKQSASARKSPRRTREQMQESLNEILTNKELMAVIQEAEEVIKNQ